VNFKGVAIAVETVIIATLCSIYFTSMSPIYSNLARSDVSVCHEERHGKSLREQNIISNRPETIKIVNKTNTNRSNFKGRVLLSSSFLIVALLSCFDNYSAPGP